MVDIHTHILPFVDDGSDKIEKSVALLKEEASIGVTDVILTPHLRKGTCVLSNDEIRKEFDRFTALPEVKEVGVRLHLGREIEIYKKMVSDFEKGDVIAVGGKFVLIELRYADPVDLDELTYTVKLVGYVPIIAHIERFFYARNVKLVEKIKASGALIQVNAQSIVDKSNKAEYAFAKKLIRRKLVDFVASDVHYGRKNVLKAAYDKVAKKDIVYADAVFTKNAEKYLCK